MRGRRLQGSARKEIARRPPYRFDEECDGPLRECDCEEFGAGYTASLGCLSFPDFLDPALSASRLCTQVMSVGRSARLGSATGSVHLDWLGRHACDLEAAAGLALFGGIAELHEAPRQLPAEDHPDQLLLAAERFAGHDPPLAVLVQDRFGQY